MKFLRSRSIEFILLILIFGLIALGLFVVLSQQNKSIVLPKANILIIIFGVSLFTHIYLRLFLPKADNIILPIVLSLTGLGLIIISRLNEHLFGLQIIWLVIGLLFFIITTIFLRQFQILRNYKYICAISGLLLFLSPVLIGTEKYGARLWLNIAGYSLQPAEVGKILLIIFFAAYLEEKKELLSISNKKWLGIQIPPVKHIGPLLVIWAISLIILVFEKDLGSSLLFMGSFVVLIYIATSRPFYLISGSIFFLAGAYICYQLFPHVQSRITIWLNPWSDLSGKGYQISQSLFALASGGMTGVGLGQGFPETIPTASTDLIFSVLGEELGLIGGFAIITLYLILFLRGIKIAMLCQSDFGKLLVSGLAFSLAFQTFIIIGGVSRLIPLTGITLPFISYGGSSLLANFILIGFIMAISNATGEEKIYG